VTISFHGNAWPLMSEIANAYFPFANLAIIKH
jgi:hypothetical protein